MERKFKIEIEFYEFKNKEIEVIIEESSEFKEWKKMDYSIEEQYGRAQDLIVEHFGVKDWILFDLECGNDSDQELLIGLVEEHLSNEEYENVSYIEIIEEI